MKSNIQPKYGPSKLRNKLLIAGAVALALGAASGAFAKGGTAKPPAKNLVAPFFTPTLIPPAFSVNPTLIHGFDATGFMQDATVVSDNTMCPGTTNPNYYGGTVKVNGSVFTVPCNSVVQMPANTLTWSDFVNLTRGTDEWDMVNNKIKGFKTHGNSSPMQYEMSITGNTVNGKNIAALIFISQQSLNGGSGIITSIDYANGNLEVGNGTGGTTIVQINDPTGTFGRAQSPDPRFSVDNENPTIHSGTGYPMCVPRWDPNNLGVHATEDTLCPQKNRPAPPCRNFSSAGVAPPVSGELSPPAFGQAFCSAYVMPSVAARLPNQPDASQQAPFEVGDYIAYNGTLFQDPVTLTDYVSAHTIEANVGIYTQPGTQPSYLAIGGFGVGTADPTTVAVTGVGQESTNRMFLEAETTDVKSPVDIYYLDIDAQGNVHNRWVTPFEMTGECNPALPLAPTCYGATGGITTQNTGPQAMRARIRAVKSPLGLLNQPTRTVRVVNRSLCAPSQTINLGIINTAAQDLCINGAALVANGIAQGQYLAPVFEYIFPENVKAGDPIIPYDIWQLGFLRFGEGAAAGGVGPLEPAPW